MEKGEREKEEKRREDGLEKYIFFGGRGGVRLVQKRKLY